MQEKAHALSASTQFGKAVPRKSSRTFSSKEMLLFWYYSPIQKGKVNVHRPRNKKCKGDGEYSRNAKNIRYADRNGIFIGVTKTAIPVTGCGGL
jgi:hypothetical protein